jgi:AcrR family transcriptional regulator
MPKKNRGDWIRAGLRRLARSGVESVRVEPLARDLGVTKGSFYWHFSDRAGLLGAMLEEWAETATEAVIARAEGAGSEPRARLERLTAIARADFDGRLELALRDWGRHDRAVRRVLDEVDGRRLGYLRRLLREAGFGPMDAEARAFLLYSVLFGDSLLAHAHGRFGRERVLRESLALIGGSR